MAVVADGGHMAKKKTSTTVQADRYFKTSKPQVVGVIVVVCFLGVVVDCRLKILAPAIVKLFVVSLRVSFSLGNS